MGSERGMANTCGWDDCFTCPFPDCIMGKGTDKVSLAKKVRAVKLDNEGMKPGEIALTLDMSERQIRRYLVDQKQEYIISKYEEG